MTGDTVTAYREGTVEGFLHTPVAANQVAVVLTHGAGSDCRAPLILKAAEQLASAGFTVLRTDLHFRRVRPKGPPFPATAAADRQGLAEAAESLKRATGFKVVFAGHSYGGRQASMLAAEKPSLAAALLLLSYPLHPPGKPAQLRTAHFPQLQTPTLFVHGENDPFGTMEEMRREIVTIPASADLVLVPKTGHDLNRGRLPWEEVFSKFCSPPFPARPIK
jgi:predicted alpha/beta-hydrolase family hydrolase